MPKYADGLNSSIKTLLALLQLCLHDVRMLIWIYQYLSLQLPDGSNHKTKPYGRYEHNILGTNWLDFHVLATNHSSAQNIS